LKGSSETQIAAVLFQVILNTVEVVFAWITLNLLVSAGASGLIADSTAQ